MNIENYPMNVLSAVYKWNFEDLNNPVNEERIEFVVDKILNDKERFIFDKKYKEGWDLRSIAKSLNVSYEWVRRFLGRITKKLTRPAILRLVKTGEEPDKLPVEYLKVDYRFYNGLINKGFDYIDDVLGLAYDDLREIKGIGKIGATNIINELNKIGYNVKKITVSENTKKSISRFMRTHNLSKEEMKEYVDSL